MTNDRAMLIRVLEAFNSGVKNEEFRPLLGISYNSAAEIRDQACMSLKLQLWLFSTVAGRAAARGVNLDQMAKRRA